MSQKTGSLTCTVINRLRLLKDSQLLMLMRGYCQTQHEFLFNLISHCWMSQYIHYISLKVKERISAQEE